MPNYIILFTQNNYGSYDILYQRNKTIGLNAATPIFSFRSVRSCYSFVCFRHLFLRCAFPFASLFFVSFLVCSLSFCFARVTK